MGEIWVPKTVDPVLPSDWRSEKLLYAEHEGIDETAARWKVVSSAAVANGVEVAIPLSTVSFWLVVESGVAE